MMMKMVRCVRVQNHTEFLLEYEHRVGNTTALTGHQEAPYGYDSVWSIALMLNNSIQRMKEEGLTSFCIRSHGRRSWGTWDKSPQNLERRDCPPPDFVMLQNLKHQRLLALQCRKMSQFSIIPSSHNA